MSDVTDKDTAIERLKEWESLLVEASATEKVEIEQLPADFNFENLEAEGSIIVFLYGAGNALMVGVARHSLGEHYQPFLVVTEKEQRQHRSGIGHKQDYRPRRCGTPNFARALENAVKRNEEIAEAATVDLQQRKEKEQAARSLAEDLNGVVIPDDLMVARQEDGMYQVHMPSVSLPPVKLRALCILLSEEGIPQLAAS